MDRACWTPAAQMCQGLNGTQSADALLDKFSSGAQSVHRRDIIFSLPGSAMIQMLWYIYLFIFLPPCELVLNEREIN